MKQLFIILFAVAFFQLFSENGSAQNWNSWQEYWGKENQPPKDKAISPGENDRNLEAGQKPTREERYCTYEQEGELLQILNELRKLTQSTEKQTGRQTMVRQKYRIAKKLRKYDDCRAEDALKALIKENSCEDLGEGEIFCVAWGADLSLQEVKSKKDLKKLIPATPLADQLKIFKKYGPHPHENEFASHAVMKFIITQAATNPRVYIPLLVEYFTTDHEILPVIRNYPVETVTGLKRCLYASEPTVVWAGINLARTLGEVSLFEDVYNVAFANKGPLDYSQQDYIETIRAVALGFFRTDEKSSLPYYRHILSGDFTRSQEYIVSGIKDLTNTDLLDLLKKFAAHLQSQPKPAPPVLQERLKEKITRMEAIQQ